MFDSRRYTKIKSIEGHRSGSHLTICMDNKINKRVVIKKIQNEDSYYIEKHANFLVNKFNVIHLINYSDDNQVLVFEFCGKTFSKFLMKQKNLIPESRIFQMLKTVFLSLSQMHKENIEHGDIKCSNIVIRDGYCYLIDFGSTERISGTSNSSVGSEFHIPPEYLLGNAHDLKADIYELAVTCFFALTLCYPFNEFDIYEYHEEQINGWIDTTPLLEASVSNRTIDYIVRMLDPNPKNRPTIDECIEFFYGQMN